MKKMWQERPRWVQLLAECILFGTIVVLAVPAGRLAAYGYRLYQNRPIAGDYASYLRGKPQSLSLYGSTTCAACKAARARLRELSIPYNDLLIDQSPDARSEWNRLQQDSVPVFVLKDKLWVGYGRQQLDALVATKKVSLPN